MGYLAVGQRLAALLEPVLRTVTRLAPVRALLALLGRCSGGGRLGVIAIPMLWLLLFFAIPFAIVLKISVAERLIAQPPYSSLIALIDDRLLVIRLNLANFLFLINDDLYFKAYLNSMKMAAISTFICLLIGYPMAYGIARTQPAWRNTLLMLVILPFWTSFLLRVYAWIGILQTNGLLNNLLLGLGLIDRPLAIMQTPTAAYIGIIYSYLPFMIMPLYATLEKMDPSLLEAAYDLGCRPAKAFFRITLPLSMPGVIAGSMLVFIPAVGEYVIPELLGGPNTLMIGRELANLFNINNWPTASAMAIAILVALVVPIVIFQRYQTRNLGTSR